ncbi:MAG: hypothetical protein KY461_15660 [Actinobacteria bacterium]|nr:hypothetical protein [Actinomycetota bacterium]
MDRLMCLVCGADNDAARHHCEACSAELGTTHTVVPSTVAMEPGEEPDRPHLQPAPPEPV